VLQASDVVASISSTTLLEAVALQRPAVVVNETSVPRHSPDLEEWRAGVEAKTSAEAVDAIVALASDDSRRVEFAPGMRAFAEEFFAGGDAPGVANVLTLLDRVSRS
jgi:hypothetical protein